MNRPLIAPDEPVDLNNCDLEPIHVPSLIQPHGMLLAARSHAEHGENAAPPVVLQGVVGLPCQFENHKLSKTVA